jgi:hypothetical protein
MHPQGVYYLAEQHRLKKLQKAIPNDVLSRQVSPLMQIPRQTPRLSLAQVKKAAAYPSAIAARHGSLRRPSVTSAPEISQTTEESPTGDAPCPPPLLTQGHPATRP